MKRSFSNELHLRIQHNSEFFSHITNNTLGKGYYFIGRSTTIIDKYKRLAGTYACITYAAAFAATLLYEPGRRNLEHLALPVKRQ